MKWLHRLLNPHCAHCMVEDSKKYEYALKLEVAKVHHITEQKRLDNEREEFEHHCETCDVLKHELELLRNERDTLLNKIIKSPVDIEPKRNTGELKPIIPVTRHQPFAARRQALESADRERARALRDATKDTAITSGTTIIGDKTSSQSIEELERELAIEDNA